MSNALSPAVFLDRDGVLNRTVVRDGVTHPPDSLAEFELLPGVPEAVRCLADAGFKLVVVTNQPDVARGLQKRETVDEMNALLCRTLPILGVMACHHDSADNCTCRKPKPGMLLEAAHWFGLDVSRSYLVGDRWSDVAAGQAAGCRASILIATPFSGRERCTPDHVVAELGEAVGWILDQRTQLAE
jgi:D-glycero-D-manno-heptose 1,7-bisphosphate phosphatase